MMYHKSSKAILIATLLQLSAAQISVEFPVDPDEFGYTGKGTICNAQRGICDILCSDKVNLNICDSTTLQFDCKCASNNSAPGLQYYEGSIPDYMCRVTASNCMEDNVGNTTALATCTSIRNKCGFLDRMEFTAPPTVSSAFTLSTGDPKPTSGSTTSSNTISTTSTAPGSSLAAPINSTPTSLADSDPESSSKSSLSTGAKAGIGAGAAIAGILILGAIGYFFYRAGKRASAAAAAAAGGSQKDSEKDAVKDSDGGAVVFGPELADTQRLEIGGREIPGELEAGAGKTELVSPVAPVEMGMSEREELEVRRVVGNK